MKNLAIILLLEVVSSAAWAWPFAEETVGSRLWTYEISDGEATVHGVEPAEGALVIPKTLGECPVTAISGYAFCQKPLIASVSIPAGLKTIGAVAFQGCTGLLSVSLPDSLTTIGDAAFYGCTALKTIRIPSGVTEIGRQAFEDCRSLTEIVWPKGCTVVPDSVFEGCTGLTSFTIPYGVESVGGYAFAGCSNMKALAIPRSVTVLGDYSLYSCSSLERICVAKDDTDRVYGLLERCNNGWWAWTVDVEFYESKSMDEGDISSSEKVIPFNHKWKDAKTGLTYTYRLDGGDAFYNGYWNGDSYVEDSIVGDVTIVDVNPLPKGEYRIPSVIDGRPVVALGQQFLFQCPSVTKVVFPNTMKAVGAYAINDCKKLSQIELNEGLVEVGKGAFRYCPFTSVVIPSTLRSMPSFGSCCGCLESIRVLGGNNRFFEVENGILYGTEYSRVLAACKDVKDVVLPPECEEVGSHAFYDCNNITRISWTSTSLRRIMTSFKNCKGLVSCDLSRTTLREIDRGGAFLGCSSLREVRFPKTLEILGDECFRDCTALRSVWFEGGVPTVEAEWDEQSQQYLPGKSVYALTTSAGDKTLLNVTTYVPRGKGWEEIIATGTWQGRPIKYLDEYEPEASYGPYVQGMSMELDTGLWGCSAKGLPTGLSYNAKTGKISGKPKKQTDAGGVEVTLTKKGAADVMFLIEVRAEDISVGCEGLSGGKLPAGVLCSPEGMGLQCGAESDVKSVSVTKLPTGMKYDSKKMLITGAPTKAGDFEVVLTVTTTAGNKKTVKMPVSVLAMPEATVGKFDGFVSVGDGNCGTFTLTTTDAGKLTAKVVTAAGTYSFSATGWDSVAEGVYSATLQTKKGDALVLSLDSTAAWDENQLTGSFTSAAIAATKTKAEVPSRAYSVSAQRNAFGKIWYFSAEGGETTGWTLAYAATAKAAALTVTLKADGTISIAGALLGTANKNGKPTSFKVSASGYANVGAMSGGAILADFAPILTVNKEKKVLSIHTNLWFDRQNGHAEGVGHASFN